MTENEFFAEMKKLGFEPDGRETKLTQSFTRKDDNCTIVITKPSELNRDDRKENFEQIKRWLGIGWPKGPRVH